MSNASQLQAEIARLQAEFAAVAALETAEKARNTGEVTSILRTVERSVDSARRIFERAVAEETAIRDMLRGFMGVPVNTSAPKVGKPRGDSLPIKVENGPLAFVVCVAGRPETAETIAKSEVITAGHYAVANAYVKRHLTSEERSWRGSSLARKIQSLMAAPAPVANQAPLRLVG